ncbi:unnamed protein product [Macrosiphum euphorbiae]|uniref:Uncharacterized protein n=1 Tax=Macrosiphum euphorbiae TaxID=13131 RepID=A0AAV0W7Q6_9HEMI|nr:unnamed protein product [Macrosiphum euphorbiae]
MSHLPPTPLPRRLVSQRDASRDESTVQPACHRLHHRHLSKGFGCGSGGTGGGGGGVERFAHGSRTTMFRPVGSVLPSIETEENTNSTATTVVAQRLQSMSSGVVRVVSADTVFA